MSNLLLRTLTMKSKIGFGTYPDLCVQELINLKKYKELISMYYQLSKINFDEEVKEYLGITFELVIEKPSKNYEMYKKNIYQMVCNINDMNREFHKDNPNRFAMLHEIKANRKQGIVSNCIRQNKEKSRIGNRNRNQSRW
jgi:hypothetical protein